MYFDPFDDFMNEDLRLVLEGPRAGKTSVGSPLFHRHINDGHYSAKEADLWGWVLARRVSLLQNISSSVAPEQLARGQRTLGK